MTQDFGYPQGTSTEMLKAFVYNEPIAVLDTVSPTSLLEAVVVWIHVSILLLTGVGGTQKEHS